MVRTSHSWRPAFGRRTWTHLCAPQLGGPVLPQSYWISMPSTLFRTWPAPPARGDPGPCACSACHHAVPAPLTPGQYRCLSGPVHTCLFCFLLVLLVGVEGRSSTSLRPPWPGSLRWTLRGCIEVLTAT